MTVKTRVTKKKSWTNWLLFWRNTKENCGCNFTWFSCAKISSLSAKTRSKFGHVTRYSVMDNKFLNNTEICRSVQCDSSVAIENQSLPQGIFSLDIIKDVLRRSEDSPFVCWFEEFLRKMNIINADYLSVLQAVFAIFPIAILFPQHFEKFNNT